METGRHLGLGADGTVAVRFDHLTQCGLRGGREVVDVVEIEHAAIRFAQVARPFGPCEAACRTALPEKGGDRRVADEGGAVYLHEAALDAAAVQFQFVDAGGEGGFARSRLTGQEDRRVG